jgi:hypothetical protein
MNFSIVISIIYCFSSSYLENEGCFVINGLLYLIIYWMLMGLFPHCFLNLSQVLMIIHLYHLLAIKHVFETPDFYLDFIHQYPRILFYDKSLLNWTMYDVTFLYPLVVGLLCSITFAFYLIQR